MSQDIKNRIKGLETLKRTISLKGNYIAIQLLTQEINFLKGLIHHTEEKTNNPIKPEHYKNNKGYDLIDVGIDYKLNFLRFNVLKYICRAGKKENELNDLKKALEYLVREIEYLEQNKNK